jgi:hypothetical protein
MLKYFPSMLRQINPERCSFIRFPGSPDKALVVFGDLLAQGQPDTGTGIVLVAVQAAEHREDLVCILLIKTDPVIGKAQLIL